MKEVWAIMDGMETTLSTMAMDNMAAELDEERIGIKGTSGGLMIPTRRALARRIAGIRKKIQGKLGGSSCSMYLP
jgi:hypothetical protein